MRIKSKDVNTIVSQRLRLLRVEHDFTQEELSHKLSCTQVCYSQYELGIRSISITKLITIAKLYRVSTDYLLGLADERNTLLWRQE